MISCLYHCRDFLVEMRKPPSILFVTFADVSSYGVRCVASYAREQGFQADILCLRLSDTRKSRIDQKPGGTISRELLAEMIPFMEQYDVIGISLFSDGFNESIALTQALKRSYPDKKVIWGSIHPTLRPHECLQYADFVCVGEGYYSLVGFLKQLSKDRMPDDNGLPSGIWTRRPDGTIRENGSSDMCMDMDTLPFPVYNQTGNFVRANNNKIIHLDREGYKKYHDYVYYTMMSQGCPNHCSYCCNYALKKINKVYGHIRNHSVDYIIREIKDAAEHYTFYNVHFMDDCFLLTDANAFEEFVERYPKEIGLPFIVMGFIPSFTRQHHVDKLVAAGMVRGRIGVQTGSRKMLDFYNRKQTNEEVIHVSEMFARHKGRIVPMCVDLILDGYQETVEDTIQTARLISQMKRPFILTLMSLKSYPGTRIEQYMNNYTPGDSYVIVNPTVINNIIGLMCLIKIPSGLLSFLLDKKQLMACKMPKITTKLIYYGILLKRTLCYLDQRDYNYIPTWTVDIVRTLRRERRKPLLNNHQKTHER